MAAQFKTVLEAEDSYDHLIFNNTTCALFFDIKLYEHNFSSVDSNLSRNPIISIVTNIDIFTIL